MLETFPNDVITLIVLCPRLYTIKGRHYRISIRSFVQHLFDPCLYRWSPLLRVPGTFWPWNLMDILLTIPASIWLLNLELLNTSVGVHGIYDVKEGEREAVAVNQLPCIDSCEKETSIYISLRSDPKLGSKIFCSSTENSFLLCLVQQSPRICHDVCCSPISQNELWICDNSF